MFYSGATGKNPKKNLALHEIFLCVGNATGTAGGGFFYQRFGFTGTCFVLILVLGLGLAVFVLLERRDRINQSRT
jgi:predicted MFS family arabinose efflux permease